MPSGIICSAAHSLPRLLNRRLLTARLPRSINSQISPFLHTSRSFCKSTTQASTLPVLSIVPSRCALLLVSIAGLGAGYYAYSSTYSKCTETQTNHIKSGWMEVEAEVQDNNVPNAPLPVPPVHLTDTSIPMRTRMAAFIKSLQSEIVTTISAIDGTQFQIDNWTRPQGGEGISCVLQNGNIFEKAGVGVSIVHGTLPSSAVSLMRSRGKNFPTDSTGSAPFFAAGISLVMHPHNPNAPTVHLNYRYFEIPDPQNPDKPFTWWFGGGSDLTPSFLYEEDAVLFHQTLKEACDQHNKAYYPKFKKWCDEYFYIPHREEHRGIGGIFFDDLDTPLSSSSTGSASDIESLFCFVQSCGHSFLSSYVPILTKRAFLPYSEEMKRFQQIRRGRYVEFNLVYDRGTKFGLATPGARVESILMSLPVTARWEYCHQVGQKWAGMEEVSEKEWNAVTKWEEKTMEVLKKAKDWV